LPQVFFWYISKIETALWNTETDKHNLIKSLCNEQCKDLSVLARYEDTDIEHIKTALDTFGENAKIVIINDTDTYNHAEILILVMDGENCDTFGERMISEMLRLIKQRMALITGVFIFDTIDEYLKNKQQYTKLSTRNIVC